MNDIIMDEEEFLADGEENTIIQTIPVNFRLNDADIVYRSSEPRILARDDLNLAQEVEDSQIDEILPGMRRPSYIDLDSKKEKREDETAPKAQFVMNDGSGLSSYRAAQLLKDYGRNVLPEKKQARALIFLEQLYQPMSLMLWVAIIVLAAIEQYIDLAILLFILFANASIAYYEVTKSASAIAALKGTLQPSTIVKRDGAWVDINATEVCPGDLIRLHVGCACPADCRLHITDTAGIEVDQSALTGESNTVHLFYNDSMKMGTTVVRGECEATVEFTGPNTYFGKTAALLKPRPTLSNVQRFIISVVLILTCLSLVMVLVALLWLLLYERVEVVDALRFTVVLLVASIPLAIEIVTTTTLALGSKELSKHGAITARLASIEDLAGMTLLCSDKTGTLTTNHMVLMEDDGGCPTYMNHNFSAESLLDHAALAANICEPPRDALDSLIFSHVNLEALRQSYQQISITPFDPISKRSEAHIEPLGENGFEKRFFVTKGAPHVILGLCGAKWWDSCDLHGHGETEHKEPELAVPSPTFSDKAGTLHSVAMEHVVEEDVRRFGSRGIRCLAVARGECESSDSDKDAKICWHMVGLLTFLDPPREDTKETLEKARLLGLAIKVVTGDHVLIAKEIARRLDIGADILPASTLPRLDPLTGDKPANLKQAYGAHILGADGFAQVFPEHKYLIVECLREMGFKVGMTGDGVNDVPALKAADVGIAVSGATDAANAAADIVLTEEGLSTIVKGIVLSRKIFARLRNFVIYRVAATLQLLFFFFIAVFAFRPVDYNPAWPVFFALPVLFLMLITLLNDSTMISIAYDRVVPSQTPCVWNLRVLFTIGSVLASVACLSSLLLLWALLASNERGSFMDKIGLKNLEYGQITVSIYLKVSVSDFLTLFSARTGENWFWTSTPGTALLCAAVGSLVISTIIACVIPSTSLDEVPVKGLALHEPAFLVIFIWLYSLAWWFLQDIAKVAAFSLLKRFNLLNINDTADRPIVYDHSFSA